MTAPATLAACDLPQLTDEQRDALDTALLLARSRPVTSIGGLAGTGKTLLVAHAVERLGPDVAVVAPTWKAAMVLRARGIDNATSVHALIYHRPEEIHEQTATGQVRTRLNFDNSLRRVNAEGARVVIVDEASMLPPKLLADIRKLVPTVILVGDHGQLEPVEGADRPGSRPSTTPANPIFNPDVRLETVHRNAGEIAHFAMHLRGGGSARVWRSSGAVVLGGRGPSDDILRKLASPDWQLIVATNAARRHLNLRTRMLLGRSLAGPEPGDRVISLSNRQGVYNGETWTLDEIDPESGRAILRSEDRVRTVSYRGLPRRRPPADPQTVVELDYAYAITCHKAQGSEWPHVLVVEPPRMSGWTHERWAYTAATRAKRSLWWYPR